MSADNTARVQSRHLAGATILQIVPKLANDPLVVAALDAASALLHAGARALIGGETGPLVEELQAFGGEWIDFKDARLSPLQRRQNAKRLEDLVASERIDLIHAYSRAGAISARAAVRKTGAWLVTSYPGADNHSRALTLARDDALLHGDRVIVPARSLAEALAKRSGLARERFAVVPRSIDLNRFDPRAVAADRIAAVRQEWRLADADRVVLVPGRLAPEKGQLVALEAARILATGGVNQVAFVVAGEERTRTGQRERILSRARALGISEMVRVGRCNDMPAAYAASDVVVMPALEPPIFARCAVEAQAAARPVVASDLGALTARVLTPPRAREDDRTGWLTAPGDALQLAGAIGAVLMLEAADYQRIQTNAYRFARATFSRGKAAAATVRVYASLFEGAADAIAPPALPD